MQQIIQEKDHFQKNHGWLDTYHHFSFAEYYNPNKMNFGPLRVFNDDIIQPGMGFDFHPHKDMEIVTYVIDGELEHKDNFGNHGVVKSGGVQRMSAGTGVVHSEFNHSKENPLRILQLWFLTKTKGIQPSWEDKHYNKKDRQDKLLQIISSDTSENQSVMKIHQDVKMFVSSMGAETKLEHKLEKNRMVYLFVVIGQLDLDGNILNTRDAATIENQDLVSFSANQETELVLLDLPSQFQFNQ